MKIMVLGGRGLLGSAVVAQLTARGHEVVVSGRTPPVDRALEFRAVDLRTGEGLEQALAGIDVLVDASNSPVSAGPARRQLVDGTADLLAAARKAGTVSHYVGVSIVGCDRVPLAYYRAKSAQEQVVADGQVPWSLLRATQFHPFVAGPLARATRAGVTVWPTGVLLQPVDRHEVASGVADLAESAPAGRAPDLAGPRVQRSEELARTWAAGRGGRTRIVPAPLPGRLGKALRAGLLTAPQRAAGTLTFEGWMLQRDR